MEAICFRKTYICMYAKSLQSCPTLCNPMDCSPPGSSVHGIFQTRILECVAMPSCKGSSLSRNRNCTSDLSCIGRQVLYHFCHLGSPESKMKSNIKGWGSSLGASVVKNLPCNAGDTGWNPGRGTKIPHAVEQPSPCTTTAELEL